MRHFILVFILFFFTLSTQGQTIKIKLVDSLTKEVVRTANVWAVEMDQWFSMTNVEILEISNVSLKNITVRIFAPGYQSKLFVLAKFSENIIALTPVHLDIHEITISTGNLVQKNKNAFHVESRKIGDLNSISSISLGEVLGRIPGVYTASLGNGISKPVVRGMQGMRVVTLLNGLRIEGQQWGGDHGLGITSLGVSAVEVIKGPASLLYGADALGGVIYLVDAPFASSGTRSLDFQTDLFSNTLGARTQLVMKDSFRKFRWLFGVNYANHADFQLPSGKFAKNSRFNDLAAKASVSFTGNRSLFGLRYTVSHAISGIPGHTHDTLATPSTFQVDERARNYELPVQFFQIHLLQASANFYRDKHSTSILLGSTFNRLIEFDEKVTIPSLSMDLFNYLAQVKWQFTLNKYSNLVAGIQSMLQNNTNDQDASDTLIPGAKMLDVGTYFNFNFERKKWNVQAGFRFDLRSLFDIDLSNQNNLYYNGFNGSIGAVYSSDKWVIRSSFSTGFRAPHLTELFSNGYHHGALRYEIGDVKLKAEQASQLDLTFERNNPHTTFLLNPFGSYIQNYIYLAPMGISFDGIPGYIYVQNDAVLFSGIDANLHMHPHIAHGLHWELSLSYLYPKSFADSAISLIPQPRLQNNLRYEFQNTSLLKLKELNIQSVLLGPQNQVAYLETTSKAYHVLDISAIFKLGKSNQITIKSGVRNVFNANYIDHLSRLKNIQMPFPGRNYFLSFGYQLITKHKTKSDEN